MSEIAEVITGEKKAKTTTVDDNPAPLTAEVEVVEVDDNSGNDGDVTIRADKKVGNDITAKEFVPKDSTKKSKPQSLKGGRNVGIFNAEDFLSRAQSNDKINNILRSPNKTSNGVRQRSVYTNIASVPVMRLPGTLLPHQAATASQSSAQLPHASQRRSSSSSLLNLERGNGIGTGVSVGVNTNVNASLSGKESASQTANLGTLPRAFMTMHLNGIPQQARYPTTFDTAMGIRGPIPRGVFSGRYALPPATAYTYDTETAYRLPQSHHANQFPAPMPPPPCALGRLATRAYDFENALPPACPGSGPIAMANGTIQLRLRDGIRIDMTLDKAVRVLNQRSMVAMALSRNCTNSALVHPNGRVLQSGSKVEIITYDGMKSNTFVRYAKMWYKGVSFTSESCALIYLVDTAGTRTTTDTFTDLTKDYTLAVFYDDSRHGPSFVQDANDVIQASSYSCADDGSEIYDINGFRITQAADGLVKVTRTHNKCLIRTSPGNGSATLTTAGIHCTASLGKTSHLFVRRNEKRMHFDGSCFIVRNAGHSAGFNENNLLIVY